MDEKIFNEIIAAGIMAPSGDNLQPWKIKPSKDYESFMLHHTFSEKDFFDVSFSASYIASGAFLENIKIAAENFGYKTKLTINKDSKSNQIAKVIFKKNKKSTNSLYNFIKKRYTSRLIYNSLDLPKEFYKELYSISEDYPSSNLIIKKKDKNISKLLYLADIIRFSTKGAHITLNNHITYNGKESGLDYRTLGVPFPKLTLKILSSWNLIKLLHFLGLTRILAFTSTKNLVDSSSGVGIIVINKDNKQNLIYSGMFFQRIWLILTKYGATLQPFATLSFFLRRIKDLNGAGFSKSQILSLKKINNELSSEIKSNKPLSIIFRYGFSKEPKIKSIRKNLSDFIIK